MSHSPDEIVRLLRDASKDYANEHYNLDWEAAEEIERLQAKVARLEALLDAVNDDIGSDYLDLIAEELES